MADFEPLGVLDSLNASLAAATHLDAKHTAVVGAARALAAKIDAWDVIVRWAREDAEGEGRPAVPQNDNTSLGTYSRYLEQLGLTVPVVKSSAAPKLVAKSDPEPAPAPAGGESPGAKIIAMQQRAAGRQGR